MKRYSVLCFSDWKCIGFKSGKEGVQTSLRHSYIELNIASNKLSLWKSWKSDVDGIFKNQTNEFYKRQPTMEMLYLATHQSLTVYFIMITICHIMIILHTLDSAKGKYPQCLSTSMIALNNKNYRLCYLAI